MRNIFIYILTLFLFISNLLYSQVIVNDPRFGEQWYLYMPNVPDNLRADIRAYEAWAITTGSTTIKIAIIESNASDNNDAGEPNYLHPDLLGRITRHNSILNSEHATEVAGVIVANPNNQPQPIGIVGINWYSPLNSYSFTNITNDFDDRITQAKNDGNRIISMSHGSTEELTDVAIALVSAYHNNITNIKAMGNGLGSGISYPAVYNSVIAVGSSTKDNTRALYSNYGNFIEFLAPGGSGQGFPNDKNILTTSTNDYTYTSGTSFSAPLVAGCAGLLLAKRSDLYNDDVKNLLIISCDKLPEMQGANFTQYHGYGRINIKNALDFLQAPYVLTNNLSTIGGTDVGTSDLEKVTIMGVPGLSTGVYWVKKHEIRKIVNFSAMTNVYVWGRGAASIGWSLERPIFGQNYCEVIPGSVTSTGATLRTYVYEVWTLTMSSKGYYPSTPDNVNFNYTVLGIPPPPLSATITGPSTAPCATGTWSANVSGGYPPYSYQWNHMYTSGGGLESSLQKGTIAIQPYKQIDTWYPVGNNTSTLNYYLCGGNSYIRVDVKDSHNTLKSVQQYVAGANGGGGGVLPKAEANNSAALSKADLKIPKEYNLEQNYPNPFNPSTIISYSIKTEGRVSLKIYNTLGQELRTLVDEIKPAGSYEAEFNASELPSGIYIYRMQSGDYLSIKKMLLIK